ERAVALSEGLKQRGIWATAIRQPTVPKNQDRLRITLTSNHTSQDIDVLFDALELSLNNLVLSETSEKRGADSAIRASGSVSKQEM
ncbi:MAG: aminotransferase class I/II-fold pyridoxal phosphate-dependent enzyme, partial [Pseudomonadota bacterium]|nr:aminotransferase class I/II-fold pyridoxal phosphate-dependent enzyme [Pseudomonadota bacterium]